MHIQRIGNPRKKKYRRDRNHAEFLENIVFQYYREQRDKTGLRGAHNCAPLLILTFSDLKISVLFFVCFGFAGYFIDCFIDFFADVFDGFFADIFNGIYADIFNGIFNVIRSGFFALFLS